MQFIDQNLLQAIEEGRFTFAYGVSPFVFLLIVVGLVAVVWFTYRKTTRPITPGWKAFFIGLRSSVLVLLLFCLLRPVITTTQVTPQETYLGVLIDDSESMQVEDQSGQARAEAVSALLLENGYLDQLAENFQVRTFRFDNETNRIAGRSAS